MASLTARRPDVLAARRFRPASRPAVIARHHVRSISYVSVLEAEPSGAAVQVEVHPTEAGVAASLVRAVEHACTAAIKEKGCCTLAVPGGSVLKMLSALATSKAGIDWSKVYLFYANHKCVPVDDKSSTHKKARDYFLDAVGAPAINVASLTGSPDAAKEAAEYESRLKKVAQQAKMPTTPAGVPVFDLVLLGMGADGHVGSLYPGRPETTATKGLVLPVDKKSPASITLTAPVMSAAKHIVIAMTGASKAAAVKRALEEKVEPGSMPAQMVQPTYPGATLVWLMDAPAASELAVAKGANALLAANH